MSRYQFSDGERWGVYTAQGDKCYMCARPLDLKSMQIDHVIPEHLLDTPERLAEVLNIFGLPADFDLNSFDNWMPSCLPCNNTKRGEVFTPSLLVQAQLKITKSHAQKAQSLTRIALATRSPCNLTDDIGRSGHRQAA